MENIKFEVMDETSLEQNSTFTSESHNGNTSMEITNRRLGESALGTEAYNQQNMEISPSLEDKGEYVKQGLFAPFSHHMRPDPEYVRLELEQSASNQEAVTKVINDRFKLMQKMAMRRREKEQEDKIKFTQISHNVDYEKVIETTELYHNIDVEDIKKTTQLLQSVNLTPCTHTKDQSEEFSDHHLEKIYWHNGLNRFIKLSYPELNTKANISSDDMLKTVTQDHEDREEDALRHMRNEQKGAEKEITFTQVSEKLGTAKRKETTNLFWDEKEAIGTSFEELLDERSESLYEI